MRLRLACASMVALAFFGCSNDPYAGRMAVSGKVLLRGEPIKDGLIFFDPLESQDTKGSSQILNGSYQLPREAGLKPGRYLVRMTAGDGKTPSREEAGQPGGSTNIVSKDMIPDDWGVKSDKEVTIKSEGSNTFEFDVK